MAVHIEFRARGAQTEENGIASWLKTRLEDSGLTVGGPERYDWGLEIAIHANGSAYFAGLPARRKTEGNWHLFVERRRSLRDRMAGTTMPADAPMVRLIEEIIAHDPRFKVVRVQERA